MNVAGLTPSQLILIGVWQGIVSFVFEVPAGVVADTISRKYSIIVSHILMGVAMLATGFVTDLGIIMLTQIVWGVAWTFSSGADVAWITDELNDRDKIHRVLARSARSEQAGSAVGIVGIGLLAWVVGLANAMILAGILLLPSLAIL